MRVFLHDYSGHPFQAQLSRELSRRGHDVIHSSCSAYSSGKGALAARPGERLQFVTIGDGVVIQKMRFRKRLGQELKFGMELARQIKSHRPDVVVASNVPIPTLLLVAVFLLVARTPWVLWHQDVQTVAIRSFAGKQLSRAFRFAAALIEVAERWCARRAAAIVVIADSFMRVHEEWGTAGKVTVIPNWAPLDEIVPTPRDNDWAKETRTCAGPTVLYSGTLGLKHNPQLLPAVVREIRDAGVPAELVVINEGPAVPVVKSAAEELDVPLTLMPFQPYERLSEVLGAGDLLVVLLERDAGAFSVPSKTLSYMCAGRPILGLMPLENQAATLVTESGGAVFPPETSSVAPAALWAAEVLASPAEAQAIGRQARAVAEQRFSLTGCARQFESILLGTQK